MVKHVAGHQDADMCTHSKVRSYLPEVWKGEGFGTQDVSRQPPGWTSLRPPAVGATPPSTPARATSIPEEEQERRTRIIQEFLEIVVPNLMCLTEFPNLGKSQHQKC